jgi:hypothetical protein
MWNKCAKLRDAVDKGKPYQNVVCLQQRTMGDLFISSLMRNNKDEKHEYLGETTGTLFA